MSSYVLELLDGSHDRAGFVSGLDSVDRYGFLRVVPEGLRMFLPKVSLEAGAEIPLE